MLNKYVQRGIEDSIISWLNSKTPILVGLLGVGKTTTAQYISLKLIQARRPVVFITTPSPTDSEQKTCDILAIKDECGNTFSVPVLYFPANATYEDVERLRDAIISTLSREVEILTKIEGVLKNAKNIEEAHKKLVKLLTSMGVSDKLIDSLKEIKPPFDLSESFHPTLGILSASIAIVSSIIKLYRTKTAKKKMEKAGRINAVIVIDDLKDYASVPISKLVEELKNYGITVLETARVDLTEYVDILDRGRALEWVKNYLHLKDSFGKSLFDEIKIIPPPDILIFSKILEANNINICDKIKMKLYTTSGGVPALAIMLYKYYGERLDEALNQIEERYGEWISNLCIINQEDIRKSLAYVYASTKTIYNELKRKNFSYVAIIAQPLGIAEDELIEFCKRTRDHCEANGLRCGWVLDDEKILENSYEVLETSFRLYHFNEYWTHLPILVETLAEYDRITESDITLARMVLLDVLYKKGMQTGRSTDRMLFSATYHIEALKNNPNIHSWLLKHALYWGSIALWFTPLFGLIHHQTIIDILNKLDECDYETLYHMAVYTSNLAITIAFIGPEWAEKLLADIELLASWLNKSDDPVITAYLAHTYARLSQSLIHTQKVHIAKIYLTKSEKILKRLKNYTCLYNILNIQILSCKIEYLLGLGKFEEAEKLCDIVLKTLTEMHDKCSDDKNVISYLRFTGENTKENIKLSIKILKSHTLYLLAEFYRINDKLDNAAILFERTYHDAKELNNDREAILRYNKLVRCNIIKSGIKGLSNEKIFEHIKCVWEEMNEIALRIDPELIDCITAEYVLANLIVNKSYPEDYNEKQFLHDDIRILLSGIAHMVETAFSLEHRHKTEDIVEEIYDYVSEKLNEALIDKWGPSSITLLQIIIAILEGKFGAAKTFAREIARNSPPTLKRLYSELATALDKQNENEIIDRLIRIFYFYL